MNITSDASSISLAHRRKATAPTMAMATNNSWEFRKGWSSGQSGPWSCPEVHEGVDEQIADTDPGEPSKSASVSFSVGCSNVPRYRNAIAIGTKIGRAVAVVARKSTPYVVPTRPKLIRINSTTSEMIGLRMRRRAPRRPDQHDRGHRDREQEVPDRSTLD